MISALAAKMTPAARGADVAQLVEQLIRNEQVTGSSPAIGSIFLAKNSTGASQGANGSIFLAKNSTGASQGANGSIFCTKRIYFLGLRGFFLGSGAGLLELLRR